MLDNVFLYSLFFHSRHEKKSPNCTNDVKENVAKIDGKFFVTVSLIFMLWLSVKSNFTVLQGS